MNVASSLTSLSIFFVILAVAFFDVTTSASLECTDDELDEAQKAFRNCVDSAKAGIVSRHAPTLDDNDTEEKEEQQEVPPPPLCDELDSMLMGCEAEVAELSRCKGRRHVDNLKAIHLSSIADVLKALNDDVKVDECQVFKQQLNQEPELNDDDDEPEVHQFPESGPESISPATSTIPSATLVFIFSVLRLF